MKAIRNLAFAVAMLLSLNAPASDNQMNSPVMSDLNRIIAAALKYNKKDDAAWNIFLAVRAAVHNREADAAFINEMFEDGTMAIMEQPMQAIRDAQKEGRLGLDDERLGWFMEIYLHYRFGLGFEPDELNMKALRAFANEEKYKIRK